MQSEELWPIHQLSIKTNNIPPYHNINTTEIIDNSGKPKIIFKKHQNMVAKFLSPESPYRGQLVYHGLGSGKTRAAIACIIKHYVIKSKIAVILPASLKKNFIEQLAEVTDMMIKTQNLDSNFYDYINLKKINNIWTYKSEYLKFYHYNGLHDTHVRDFQLFIEGKCLVIIDEVHNFIHMCIKEQSRARKLYDHITLAEDIKICAMSGTPCINRPYELTKLINMLRGPIQIKQIRYNDDKRKELQKQFENNQILFMESNIRNKNGTNQLYLEWSEIKNNYKLIREKGCLQYDKNIVREKNLIPEYNFHAFGDENFTNEDFNDDFIENNENSILTKNLNYFKSRCVGIVSYYETPEEELSNYPNYINQKSSHIRLNHYYKNFISFLNNSIKANQICDNDNDIKPAIINFLLKLCGYENDSIPFNENLLNYIDDNRDNLKNHRNSVTKFKRLETNYISYLTFPQIIISRSDFNPKTNIFLQLYIFNAITFEDVFVRNNAFITDRIYQFLAICGLTAIDLTHWQISDIHNKKECFDFIKSIAINTIKLENVSIKVIANPKWGHLFGNSNFEFQEIDDISYQTYYFQFDGDHLAEYERARSDEKRAETNKKKQITQSDEIKGSYREKSRTLCNFYASQTNNISPKFDKLMQILKFSKGKAIVYSSFKTKDIGGIYKLGEMLEQKMNYELYTGNHPVLLNEKIKPKLRYAIFTSDVNDINRESIIQLFNHDNNINGDHLNIILMTQSGAEGINFKAVRQVHIIEPHWNMVRLTQVCGRARRMDSHKSLPLNEQNISVFLYIMSFRTISESSKLHLDPVIKQDDYLSTDEHILYLAKKKESLNKIFQNALSEIAVDKNLYNNNNVQTFHLPIVNQKFIYLPSYSDHKEELQIITSSNIHYREYIPKIVPKSTIKSLSPWKLKDGTLLDNQPVYYSESIKDNVHVKELYTRTNPPTLLGEIIGYEFIPV
tara:strand:+ start:2104 stop:4989 length:2886 start_codon:yes stop_codon:yes gene_type:complete